MRWGCWAGQRFRSAHARAHPAARRPCRAPGRARACCCCCCCCRCRWHAPTAAAAAAAPIPPGGPQTPGGTSEHTGARAPRSNPVVPSFGAS
eukprot:363274-Prymnesium_polylepis.1